MRKGMVMERIKKRKELRWSMVGMLVTCWFLPLLLTFFILFFFISDRMNNQLEDTIVTSADKAIEICRIRLSEAIEASKDSSYMTNIKESYAVYLRDRDRHRLDREVTQFIRQQYSYNPSFDMTLLYFVNDPDTYYAVYRGTNTYANVTAYDTYAKEEIARISRELDTGIAFVNINDRIYMVRNIVDGTFHPFAVIIMELNRENMFGSLEGIWGYSEGDIFIDGVSIFHVYKEDPCKELIKDRYMARSDYYHGKNGSYIYKRLEIGRHRVAFAITLDETAIMDETIIVKYVLGLLIAFMVPLIVMIFMFFHQRVNRPIEALRMAYREIERENYGYQIEAIARHEELADLGEAFNAMSDKLKYQFEKIYLEELALRDANIMALQSQINPHFLNNTLEIINWEVRMAGNYKVSAMIEALSTMLEATMNRKSEQLIPLSEEMSYADAYLYIMSQRFGEMLEVTKEIDERYLYVRVPRLIIQPILENAIEHGLNFRNRGKLQISIFARDDKLYIEIINNGALTQKDKQRIEELLNSDTKEIHSVSLGIRNVNKRVKMICGPDCGLTIKSNNENHTVSTIIVKIDNSERQ